MITQNSLLKLGEHFFGNNRVSLDGGKKHFRNPDLLQQLSALLDEGYKVVVFYFDIVNTKNYDTDSFLSGKDDIKSFRHYLKKTVSHLLEKSEVLAVDNLWGNDFVAIIVVDGNTSLEMLPDICKSCSKYVSKHLREEKQLTQKAKPLFYSGYSSIDENRGNLEIQLYKALLKAQEIARCNLDDYRYRLSNEFKNTLNAESINMLYQPIISMDTGLTLGWEALARGPLESYFFSPQNLFSFAEEEKLLFPLEKICRKVAIDRLGKIEPSQKLFLNIHPNTIRDPNFKAGETIKIIRDRGLKPQNIVFEITERHHISDFYVLNKVMSHYRSQGFLVAVDDAGAGFSSLQSIAELRPDYIKIDLSLIRKIHENPVKIALLETMVIFAEKIGSSIIAEGVEEKEELDELARIGVHCSQGYYLGFPRNPKELPDNVLLV